MPLITSPDFAYSFDLRVLKVDKNDVEQAVAYIVGPFIFTHMRSDSTPKEKVTHSVAGSKNGPKTDVEENIINLRADATSAQCQGHPNSNETGGEGPDQGKQQPEELPPLTFGDPTSMSEGFSLELLIPDSSPDVGLLALRLPKLQLSHVARSFDPEEGTAARFPLNA
ncbi:hypothetical protein BCR34DRAFT_615485 [Clohesyomyces aquaticus]|uniref:Uncharacterized protein n=1 Tax=Clohesyomyces aquaticus TaxID=1231657 RepID=A0A1Y1ZIJ0_9PLEO|nr:hypothetical protein BCR34DRAFT_615485 [Clohesyomyces aquaticus]